MKKDRTNKLEVQLRETFDYMDNKRSKSEQRYSPADQFSFRTSLRSADRLSLVSEEDISTIPLLYLNGINVPLQNFEMHQLLLILTCVKLHFRTILEKL